MAAKTRWHRDGTKLRQCQPMYTGSRPNGNDHSGQTSILRRFNGYLVRVVDGSCAKRLTIEFYTVVMLLTFILGIVELCDYARA